MILTLTGPSGVGKTTLLNNVMHALPHAQPLESVTTRAPRPTDESSFVYVSDEEFDAMQARGEFLWQVEVHSKRYATRKAAIDLALTHEVYIAVLLIEAVETLHDYATLKGKPKEVTSLYIEINNEAELHRRFAERNDMSDTEVESRIAECRSWNAQAKNSRAPFVFLDGNRTREALLAQALAIIAPSS